MAILDKFFWKHYIARKSVQQKPLFYMRTDGRTYQMKQIGIFLRLNANAPNNPAPNW